MKFILEPIFLSVFFCKIYYFFFVIRYGGWGYSRGEINPGNIRPGPLTFARDARNARNRGAEGDEGLGLRPQLWTDQRDARWSLFGEGFCFEGVTMGVEWLVWMGVGMGVGMDGDGWLGKGRCMNRWSLTLWFGGFLREFVSWEAPFWPCWETRCCTWGDFLFSPVPEEMIEFNHSRSFKDGFSTTAGWSRWSRWSNFPKGLSKTRVSYEAVKAVGDMKPVTSFLNLLPENKRLGSLKMMGTPKGISSSRRSFSGRHASSRGAVFVSLSNGIFWVNRWFCGEGGVVYSR